MFSKIFFYLAFMITISAYGAEIMSRIEVDDNSLVNGSEQSNDIATDTSAELTASSSAPSDCGSSAESGSLEEDDSIGRTEEMDRRMRFEMSDNPVLPEAPVSTEHLRLIDRLNPEPARPMFHFSVSSDGTGLQLVESVDRIHPMDNHEIPGGPLHLIDPHMSPQMQLVDNTLRLMAIKSSVDDLAMRIFPNLQMLQHVTRDR